MGAIGLIPARLESSRLPRKLLLAETGRPLLQYAWEAATRAESLDEVIVASDSDEVAETVRGFGGRCEMTGQHASGTDRIAEVVRNCGLDAEIVVNIQGDEPEIESATIDTLVQTLADAPAAEMSTLSTPIQRAEDRDDPSCVKVVCAADGRALYFSRSVIPHVRDAQSDTDMCDSPWQLHLGLYAYRRAFLLRLAELPLSHLEQLEKLEQLRALEAGACIQVATIEHPSVGIDTPEDYARFIERQRGRAA
jgi:3-deoxy-manno-octulosonate cytidylyltransferase (CMP-KDO synthetase)